MKVNECNIMEAVSCETETPVSDVAKLMKEKQQRHVVVTDDGKPVGMISPVDIVNKVIAEEKDYKELTAKDVMNTPISSIDGNEEVSRAYFKMASKNTFSCPVTGDGKLKGMITLNEAIKHLMKEVKE